MWRVGQEAFFTLFEGSLTLGLTGISGALTKMQASRMWIDCIGPSRVWRKMAATGARRRSAAARFGHLQEASRRKRNLLVEFTLHDSWQKAYEAKSGK